MTDKRDLKPDTRLGRAGRNPARQDGAVNPPVHRASTVVLDDMGDLYSGKTKTYALEGMAVHDALKEALMTVEGGEAVTLAPSGLNACALAMLTVARKGGRMLVADPVYVPTRRFCNKMLARLGVETTYYDPRIGAAISDLLTDDVCGVFLESPGSQTFEVQDVPAIAAAARARGVLTMIDNTWSAGVYFKPFDHGVDFSIQALTKYQAGHADVFCGAVLSATAPLGARVRMAYKELGLGVSPDDAYLVLRGMRTMHVRMARQQESGLVVARWLEARPEVARVIHPALPSHPDHALWKRDFTGAAGLFSFVLKPVSEAALSAFVKALNLFAMGFSWGGFESLIIPCDANIVRTATQWQAEGPLLRVSIGLEDPGDLTADFAQAFQHL